MIDYAVFTDKGGREINEDSVQYCEKDGAYCFVLCDGLGGHGRGEEASSLVSDTICSAFKHSQSIEDFFNTALQSAQDELLNKQQELHAFNEMKTTAVVLCIYGNKYRYAYIGDSRLYCFRKAKMLYRTQDHSVPQMLAQAGDIKEKHIRRHPDRNRLLRVMGIEWDCPKYEVSEEMQLEKDTAFLLCTDGFWEPVTEKEMVKLLKNSADAQQWLDKMALLAKNNSIPEEMDNFSAVAVRYKEDA